MQFNTFVSSEKDIEDCIKGSIAEVLIEPACLSREGAIAIAAAQALSAQAKAAGIRSVLVWDLLMTEGEFDACSSIVTSQIGNFDAVRVQCPGALRYLTQNYPGKPVQFIAETGNCNIASLEGYCRVGGSQLERIVLSLQLTAKKVAEYVKRLPVECELLGLGPILLFYSRRRLLADLAEEENDRIEVFASTSELHDRPLPVVDNIHGTLMYLDRDLLILDRLHEFGTGLPAYLRLDLRAVSRRPNAADGIAEIAEMARSAPQLIKDRWPKKTSAPFLRSNETTKQFKLLPNNSCQRG